MLSDLMNQILIVKLIISQRFGLSKKMYPRSYRRLFLHVSEWEKVFLGPICDGHGNCITTIWPRCQFCFNDRPTSWGLDCTPSAGDLKTYNVLYCVAEVVVLFVKQIVYSETK